MGDGYVSKDELAAEEGRGRENEIKKEGDGE